MAAYINFDGYLLGSQMGLLLSRGSWITLPKRKNSDIFSYHDDITVAVVNHEDHDMNVEAFLDVVKRQNLTINLTKSVISASSSIVLGYLVQDGNIRTDTERLYPLKELPLHINVHSLRRTLELFAYYAK